MLLLMHATVANPRTIVNLFSMLLGIPLFFLYQISKLSRRSIFEYFKIIHTFSFSFDFLMFTVVAKTNIPFLTVLTFLIGS